MYRLYDFGISSSAWRVRIVLALKGLAYERLSIDLFSGTQYEETYRQVTALGQVPVLEWDGEGGVRRLGQSLAIISYLDACHPEPALFPADPLRRAEALQLTEIVNSGIQPLQNRSVLDHVGLLGGDGRAFAARYIARGLAAMEGIAARTAGRFLVGDALSVADVYLVPQLAVARRMGVSLDELPRLTRVEGECAALPAFVAAAPP